MAQYIDKAALVAEIEKKLPDILACKKDASTTEERIALTNMLRLCKEILSFINTLEVKDPYEQCIQYDSIKAGIQAHAKTYSFNIESHLFPQLTKEQQALWRKEIEQACISGGDMGYLLAKDPRYKENLEVKEVNLREEIDVYFQKNKNGYNGLLICKKEDFSVIAKHFFELGISVSNSTKVATPDVDDVLKENGVNPDSKEAKIIKESYFMAIEKLAQKGEKV